MAGKEPTAVKERKYKEDYAIEVELDEKGRDRRKAVYRGDYFNLNMDAAERHRFLRACLAHCAAFVVFYLLYMFQSTPSSYCIYVLPFAAAALIPLAYWVMGLASLCRAPENMTSVQKEKSIGRASRSAMGCTLLVMLSCVGDVIFMLTNGQPLAELPGFAALLCAGIAALAALRRMRPAYDALRVNSPKKE